MSAALWITLGLMVSHPLVYAMALLVLLWARPSASLVEAAEALSMAMRRPWHRRGEDHAQQSGRRPSSDVARATDGPHSEAEAGRLRPGEQRAHADQRRRWRKFVRFPS